MYTLEELNYAKVIIIFREIMYKVMFLHKFMKFSSLLTTNLLMSFILMTLNFK